MWYVMSEQELRQPEPLEAALVMALGWGLGLGMGLWGAAALALALALSLLRDARRMRRSVRAGRVRIYTGLVRSVRGTELTLCQGRQQVTLRLPQPPALQPGDRCRLALEMGRRGGTLLALRRQRCALRLVPARG